MGGRIPGPACDAPLVARDVPLVARDAPAPVSIRVGAASGQGMESPARLTKLWRRLATLLTRPFNPFYTEMQMNVQTILSKLEYNDGIFPVKALKEAIHNQESITPALCDVLQYTIDNSEWVAKEDDYFAHMYALYLLAQFREKRAYPLIIDLFSLPGNIIWDMVGDSITEDLSRILASVHDGNDRPLKSMIENKGVYEYVRAAGLESLLILVAAGLKPREEVVQYYKELFNGGLEREYSFAWDALVQRSTRLYPGEVYDEIKWAYEKGLVDSWFIDLGTVEKTMKDGMRKTLEDLPRYKGHDLVEDAIGEMGKWDCFSSSEDHKKEEVLQPKTAPNKRKKIGRNAPCPCGSGKKYKKCCLR